LFLKNVFNFKNKSLKSSLVLVLLVASLPVLIPRFRKPLLDVFRYPLSLFTLIKREITGIVFYHKNFLENALLKSQIDLLRRKLNDTVEVSQENARLSNLLSLANNAPYKVIAARVIGRDPSDWASAIIIDKGLGSGIKKGLVAINYLGLVGRVVEVSGSSGKIMLINDPALSVSAIDQRSRQEGLVCGSFGGSLVMKYLPQKSDIKINDMIITSGLTDVYPKGLLIGSLSEIGQEFSGLSSYAVIKPAVELSSLEEVLIIIR
jgi:rod shape-determining protein MreC